MVAAALHLAAVLVIDAGFAWLAGSLLARRWLARAYPQLLALCQSRLRQAETVAASACLVGSLAAVWAAAALMGDVSLAEAFGTLPMVLAQTGVGQAGLASMAAATLMLVLLAMGRGGAAQGALLLAFALARASVSHAGEHGLVSVALGVEWLHLVLIGVWLGSVAVAGWLVLPAARQLAARPSAYLASLSRGAGLALAGIVASGAFNAWQRLGAPAQLTGTAYGQTLTLKLALVVLAVLLGAYNRFAGFPDAARGHGGAALAVLRLESVLLLGALAAAVLLASQAPPV